jgi:glycosyltransferase involved in cell wall biosynthesis
MLDTTHLPPRAEGRALSVLALGVNWFRPGSGGLDRVYADLMAALPAAGVATSGLVLGPPDVAELTGGRVQAFGRPGASLPERLWRARALAGGLAASGRFDLVAAHFALFALPALDRLRGLPLVVHFHGPWAEESAQEGAGGLSVAAKRAMERLVYRRAERVIVLSDAFAAVARDRYGVPAGRIRKVPGSVELDRFDLSLDRRQARERLGWPQDRRILLSVRRLARRMGLDRLVAAMAEVARAQPDVLLLIAGRGQQEAALRAQVAALGLAGHVRFLGFLPDAELPLAYRAAEINVVPTLALEGFGLTAAEALAAGTPSMVAPVGALPEVVGDLSPALIFRSGAPADFAAGLLGGLRGTAALPDAAACRAYVRARYGAAHAAAAVAAVYREVA